MTYRHLCALALALLAVGISAGCRTEAQVAGSEPVTLPAPVAPVSLVDPPLGDKLVLSNEQWEARLPAERYYILRQKGTERPGTGPLLKEERAGVFRCAGCGAPLYESNTKFDSGTGWPSFSASLNGRVTRASDGTFGWTRVEILCARCDGHLGHIFKDGPKPTGERHCVNSLAMTFSPAPEPESAPSTE